jgi:hypothetical protein
MTTIRKAINEKTSCTLEVTFKDEDKVSVVPETITYRIDDVDSGTVIKAATAFTLPASVIEIEITSAQNKILNESNDNEERVVTVEFDYNSSTKHGTSEYRYKILNLLKVNSES